MTKVSAWWLLIALIIGAAAAYIYFNYIRIPDKTFSVSKRKKYDVVTLALPNSVDMDISGPKYWEAYHKLTEMLPCSICRDKAVPFISFFHDVVNKHTGKELYDKENFQKHIDYLKTL